MRGTLQSNAMENWSMAHDLRLTTFCGLMHLCYYACAVCYNNTFKLEAQLVRAFFVIVAASAANTFGSAPAPAYWVHFCYLYFFAFVVAFIMLCVCIGALLRLLLLLATTSLVIAAWLHFLEGRLKNVLFIFFPSFFLYIAFALMLFLRYVFPSAFFQYTYTCIHVFFLFLY